MLSKSNCCCQEFINLPFRRVEILEFKDVKENTKPMMAARIVILIIISEKIEEGGQ